MIKETGLLGRIAELRRVLEGREAAVLATNTGAILTEKGLHLNVWGQPVRVTVPGFVACNTVKRQALDMMTQALLAYYFYTSDGMSPAGLWIAFTELPDGRFYTNAFQGYTGQKLVRAFGNDVVGFGETAVAIGGSKVEFADAAFQFQILPKVAVLVAGWMGDEDFPPSYKLLFDANTSHHLPTDACAIIGSMLTGKLLKQRV
ncbi:MAG: DUF3786 domain-containing protein [Chloroflexi bacterium]|nr:MAG: DUF3786 domain-containing protein [Chloroflexota bacterium]